MRETIIYNQDMIYAERSAEAAGMHTITMMHNAGAAIFKIIKERFPRSKVLVICGSGNNGGDGLVIAKLLVNDAWPVTVLCNNNHNIEAIGAHIDYPLSHEIITEDYEIIIDALFGSGLSRNIEQDLARLILSINNSSATVISVDIPSGIDGNTGHVMGSAVRADLTVTFQAAKVGHMLYPGKSFVGELAVADIGINNSFLPRRIFINTPRIWGELMPTTTYRSHKYSRGHLLVIGGSMPGASILASLAGQRSAAGITTLAIRAEQYDGYEMVPSSIIKMSLAYNDITTLISAKKISATIIGPGFGEGAMEYLGPLLGTNTKIVVDADAITALSGGQCTLRSQQKSNVVLTPHMGEFARLFPDISPENKLIAALEAAKISGAVVVLKGADTIIASPDGLAVINSDSNFKLATAGSGDVLAGIIGGLLSAGMPIFWGAAAGVWIHAECAKHGNFATAEDLANHLTTVLDNLAAQNMRRDIASVSTAS